MENQPVLVGVDLGGTNIRAAVATGPSSHAEPAHEPTPHDGGIDGVVAAIAACVARACQGRRLTGLAIGIPGPLDPVRGVVYASPNLPGWEGFAAAEAIAAAVGCPIAIQNDANLAGYAEWVAGAGRGTGTFIFITASTGVGGALILNGALHAGAAGTAGELGHVPLDGDGPPCGQGHPGCLEGSASGTGIAHAARRALDAGESSSLSALAPEALDAHAVQEAAEAGDRLSHRIFTTAAHTLGRAVGGYINVFSPEVVAIGGGLINGGPLLFEPLRAGVAEMAFTEPAQRCRIVAAELGTDAGLVGAVAWAVQSFGEGDATPPHATG